MTRALKHTVIGLIAGLVAVGAAYLPLVETYERRALDLRTWAFAKPERADKSIVVVVIDQRSIDIIAAPAAQGGLNKGWPWPRDYYKPVVEYLVRSGARAVAFDMLFSEQSIFTREALSDDDANFASATVDKPVLQSVMLTREVGKDAATLADRTWPPGLRDERRARRLAARPADAFNKATLPIEPLVNSAAALGWIGFEPDEDGTCRSVLPAATYSPHGDDEAVEVWSLPFALASLIGARVEARPGRRAAEHLTLDGRRVRLDEDGRLLLRFHGGEGTYDQYPFVAVLRSALMSARGLTPTEARPDQFRDKIVLIGSNAAGLLDLRATAADKVLPGYLIHATALDNLLHDDALRRPTWPWRAALVLIVATLAGAFLGAMPTFRESAIAALGLVVAYVAAGLWLFGARGVWVDLLAPAVGIVVAHLGVTGYGYLTEGRERRFLRSAFSRYVAPEVVERLVQDPGQLALGGETRELTVMFADVAGFTSLSEGRAPREIVELMNECFTELTAVIQGHGGTVDKFIGDAVMAFWNAPVDQPDHAARACRATEDLLAALQRLNTGWSQRGLPRISMRVGLATGPALVGNVGSKTKFNYTVMGDTVNLASRLEGAAKVYGTLSLVAGGTVSASHGAVPLRELDWLQVKGRSEPVPVYEVVPTAPSPAQVEIYDRYAKGLAAYRNRRFDEAREHFAAALKIDPDDGPSREMLGRCDDYLLDPPALDWRGEHVLHSK